MAISGRRGTPWSAMSLVQGLQRQRQRHRHRRQSL